MADRIIRVVHIHGGIGFVWSVGGEQTPCTGTQPNGPDRSDTGPHSRFDPSTCRHGGSIRNTDSRTDNDSS